MMLFVIIFNFKNIFFVNYFLFDIYFVFLKFDVYFVIVIKFIEIKNKIGLYWCEFFLIEYFFF